MPRQSYDDLARWIRTRPARLDATRLVVVDGPAGSGKTTFANQLAGAAEAAVLHMDDLYDGWTGLDAALWRRLHHGVLAPLANGERGWYQRYDWQAGRFAEWHEVTPVPILILEGVGSAHRAVGDRATLQVWVEAPEERRLQRGLDRDGPALREEWVRWLRLEAEHFAADATRARADLVVDGAAGDAPERASYAVIEDRRRPTAPG